VAETKTEPPPAAPVDRAQQQLEFVRLCDEEAELKARLAVIAASKERLQPGLLEYMLRMEQQHVRVGGRTLYISRELWASPIVPDTEDEELIQEAKLKAIRALKRAFPGYVKEGYHSGAVSALFREWDRDETPVPRGLAKTWMTAERFKLAARK
jgi:hypothetical protein